MKERDRKPAIASPLDDEPRIRDENVDPDSLAESGNRIPELAARYNIDVREFVVLALLHEAGPMTPRALASQVPMSPTSVDDCIQLLRGNQLLRMAEPGTDLLAPTEAGRALVRESAFGSDTQPPHPTPERRNSQ